MKQAFFLFAAVVCLLAFAPSLHAQAHPDFVPESAVRPSEPIKPPALGKLYNVLDRVTDNGVWIAEGFDLGTTAYGIAADGRTEANPALRGRGLTKITAISFGGTAMSAISSHWLFREKPKLASGIRIGVTVAHLAAGLWNIKTARN